MSPVQLTYGLSEAAPSRTAANPHIGSSQLINQINYNMAFEVRLEEYLKATYHSQRTGWEKENDQGAVSEAVLSISFSCSHYERPVPNKLL